MRKKETDINEKRVFADTKKMEGLPNICAKHKASFHVN